jgi:Flp pilus assembly protein TadG
VRRDRAARRRSGEAGQSVTEFALLMPIMVILLFGMLEFSSAFNHLNAMAYATREGARVGASLGKGGSDPSQVDPTIIAAVQRGLTDPILIENITLIEIYKPDAAGNPVSGKINRYDRFGTLIGTAGWPASSRVASLTSSGESIGVRVTYDFHPITPFAPIFGLLTGGPPPYTTITMTDITVMKLEPPP